VTAGSRPGTVAAILCTLAFVLYTGLGLASHAAFRTNAFDLSVFDYALWTTAHGQLAYVPMFGYSLFAQHFMPTLLLLVPLPALFGSPVYLIVLQAAFFAGAGLLLYLLAASRADRYLALGLCIAFLFARRPYSAVTSYFYIESAEPLLVFGMVWALRAGRRGLYAVLLLLALGCKEDVAIYTIGFGCVLAVEPNTRRAGLLTAGVSAMVLLAATLVVVPHVRAEYGLTGVNHFVDVRYGSADASLPEALLLRLFSQRTLTNITPVLASTGFLALAAPAWFAIAVPGLLLNLVADPASNQTGLIGHYMWPMLPWLFVAAVEGTRRLPQRIRRWAPLLVPLIALADTPVPRTLATRPWQIPAEASQLTRQLDALPAAASVTAQPNLIPHLPRRVAVQSSGVYEPATLTSQYVLYSTVGDLWPLSADAVVERTAALQRDGVYRPVSSRPLFAFERGTGAATARPASGRLDGLPAGR
jgi:uncharacterized membrane protein